VLKQLGSGGMGVVYLARDLAGGGHVALKTIKPSQVRSRSARERFLREASILRQLQHPNIVAFRDISLAGVEIFFVMEYVDGLDAARLVRRDGPLAVPRAAGLVCQMLDALAYAQGLDPVKFVHRDIKPSNVLIAEPEGREVAKLTDFGLARMYQTSRLGGLTLTGGTGGTLGFMPPEQITHFHEARAPADQYAVGATLYFLLTGKLVYDFPDRVDEQFTLILNQEPVPLQTRRPDLPGALAAVVGRALARDPRWRFGGVDELRQALLPFCTTCP
jgi:serine/threonine-protein kinase